MAEVNDQRPELHVLDADGNVVLTNSEGKVILAYTPDAWNEFVNRIKSGELDNLEPAKAED